MLRHFVASSHGGWVGMLLLATLAILLLSVRVGTLVWQFLTSVGEDGNLMFCYLPLSLFFLSFSSSPLLSLFLFRHHWDSSIRWKLGRFVLIVFKHYFYHTITYRMLKLTWLHSTPLFSYFPPINVLHLIMKRQKFIYPISDKLSRTFQIASCSEIHVQILVSLKGPIFLFRVDLGSQNALTLPYSDWPDSFSYRCSFGIFSC